LRVDNHGRLEATSSAIEADVRARLALVDA
jgi:hypothetical protein